MDNLDCYIEAPDGGVCFLNIPWHRLTTEPTVAKDTGKELIDLDEYLVRQIAENQNPNIRLCVGRQRVLLPVSTEQFRGKDGRLRPAWKFDAINGMAFDMAKARELTMARVRHVRDDLLIKEDKKWNKFNGQRNDIERDKVEAKRQFLRDIPATAQIEVDGITGPTQLDSYEPNWPI
tara:strand:+ start:375 stop:905 length:531 start_codon:yes stop_codon:yes gene_type:complete